MESSGSGCFEEEVDGAVEGCGLEVDMAVE